MTTPLQVVERIQKAYGVAPSAARGGQAQGATLIQSTLANALELLSRDLYNYEGHFLLELLQNADDNHYPDGVVPSLDIAITPDGILVTNNEVGFNEANVKALSTIGSSTKRATKADATGEKGIGFKAVFKISDRPEIHSNGFHFCFDTTKYGNLGMVVPEWLPAARHLGSPGNTVIALPSTARQAVPADLADHVTPELPLFLRRLRRIRLSDSRSGIAIDLQRTDVGAVSTVRRVVSRGGETKSEDHRFFRFERAVEVGDLNDEKREGIAKSTVVIAVPLDRAGGVDRSGLRKLFAFLPVKDAGLPFVVHADFVLNTSREDVIWTRPWNTRLRDELGAALAHSVLEMQTHDSLRNSALRVLSNPRLIVDPFLRPIMKRAIDLLRSLPCIPAEPDGWCSPSEAFRHDKQGLSALIPPSELKAQQGRQFVSRIATDINDALDLLEIKPFGLSELLAICKSAPWMLAQDTKWLVALYSALEPVCGVVASLAAVKKCPILLVSSGEFVSVSDDVVYRSLDKTSEYGFESELRVLAAKVLRAAKSLKATEAVDRFLRLIGVHDAGVVAVVDGHIIPRHQSKPLSCELLVAHAKYLRDHFESYKQAHIADEGKFVALGRSIHLISEPTSASEERKRFPANSLYVGKAYGDPNHMESLLGASIDGRLIGVDYLRADPLPKPAAWRDLFKALGAWEMPRVEISDFDCEPSEEFSLLLAADDPKTNGLLLQLLDRQWSFWSARVPEFSSKTLCDRLAQLRVATDAGAEVAVSRQFQPTDENRAVFGNSVAYLKRRLQTPECARALGVVQCPSVPQVLDRLEAISREGAKDLDAIRKLYRYLEQYWEQDARLIKSRFTSAKIVFCCSGDGKVLAEPWHRCCWSFPSKLRQYSPIASLDTDWGQHKEFFMKMLKVRKFARCEDLIATLHQLSEVELDAVEVRALAVEAYVELDKCISREEPEEGSPWIEVAKKGHRLLTTKGDWWRNDGDLFAPDQTALADLFEDCESLRFICIPHEQLPKVQRMLKAFEVEPVSAAERYPPDWREGKDDVLLTTRITARWDSLARIVYVKNPQQYEKVKEDGRLYRLRELTARCFQPLELDIRLAGHERRSPESAFIFQEGEDLQFFVNWADSESWIKIAAEIDRFLGLADSVADLLTMVLAAVDAKGVADIFAQKKCAKLPQSEIEELEIASRCTEPDETADMIAPADMTESRLDQRAEASGALPAKEASAVEGPARKAQADAGGAPGDSVGSAIRRAAALKRDSRQAGPTPLEAAEHVGLNSARSHGARPPNREKNRLGRGNRADSDPTTKPSRDAREPPKQQRRPGRLISYVESDVVDSQHSNSGAELQELREATDEAAIKYVVVKERDEGRVPIVMDHSNPGFDIDSKDTNGNTVRYIEVKGLSGEWGERGVTMSNVQFDHARSQKDRAWLYVVEFATDLRRQKLWRIQDPASKANKFGFDHGWRQAGDEAPAPIPAEALLKAGAKMMQSDASVGTVLSVKIDGVIYTVKSRRADGREVSRSGPIGLFVNLILRD